MSDAADLNVYVPRVQLEWLATDPARRHRDVDGTLVFADVSGFTPLSERLARRGKVGAEELTDVLNEVFTSLLDVAASYGGDLLKFGGDALLLLFKGDAHAARAATAAVALQTELRPYRRLRTAGGVVQLRMSIGVASGRITLYLVGESSKELFAGGDVVTEVLTMEAAANAGQILIAQSTQTDLDPAVLGDVLENGRLLARSPRAPTAPLVPPARAEPALAIPLALRDHLRSAALEGEHRHAVLCFLQIAGAKELYDNKGAAAVAHELDVVVSAAQASCERHGVTFLATDVDKDGGKILGVAGAPHSAVDDDDRMLRMLRDVVRTPTQLQLRAGANRGRAFAVTVGSPTRRTYAVMGDGTNLAARVMGKAPFGSVLATTALVERLLGHWSLTPVEPFAVKGKSMLIAASEVGDEDAAPARAAAPAVGPFVGRDAELAEIRGAAAVTTSGRAARVAVVGPAGMGKTRLVEEALAPLGLRCVLRIDGSDLLRNDPWGAARRPLRRLLTMAEDDASVEDALREAVASSAPELRSWIPLLAVPFGLSIRDTTRVAELADRFRPERIRECLASFLAAILSARTAVVVDNAQWLDDSTSAFVATASERADGPPWLWLVLQRDNVDGDAGTLVHVPPLAEDSVIELIDTVTAAHALAPHVVRAIVRRADGVPLFVHELLRVAMAGGDVDALPETLEAVISASVDAIPADDRLLLRRASVLGSAFPLDVLAALVETTAEELAVRLQGLSHVLTVGSDGEVRFRDQVVREVAYEGLAYRRRRELHRRAAETLLASDPETGDSLAPVLAYHWYSADEPSSAWTWSRRAGATARQRWSPKDAMTFLRWAVDAAGRLPDLDSSELAEVYEGLGDVCDINLQLDNAYAAYTRARRLLADDPLADARLMGKLALVRERQSAKSVALRWYTRAVRRLADARDEDAQVLRLKADLTVSTAAVRLHQGHRAEAARLLDSGVALARAASARDVLAHAYYLLDWVYSARGGDDRHRYRDAALPIFEELGDLPAQAKVCNNRGIHEHWEGNWDEAERWYRRALDLNERIGDLQEVGFVLNNLGQLLADRGDLAAAERELRRALSVRREGVSTRLSSAHINLGRVLTHLGRYDEARDQLVTGHDQAAEGGDEEFRCEAAMRLLELDTYEGRPDLALARVPALERALHDVGDPPVLWTMLDRLAAVAFSRRGDLTEARRRAERSIDAATRAGSDFDGALAVVCLSRIAVARGDEDAEVLTAKAAEEVARLDLVLPDEAPLLLTIPASRVIDLREQGVEIS